MSKGQAQILFPSRLLRLNRNGHFLKLKPFKMIHFQTTQPIKAVSIDFIVGAELSMVHRAPSLPEP